MRYNYSRFPASTERVEAPRSCGRSTGRRSQNRAASDFWTRALEWLWTKPGLIRVRGDHWSSSTHSFSSSTVMSLRRPPSKSSWKASSRKLSSAMVRSRRSLRLIRPGSTAKPCLRRWSQWSGLNRRPTVYETVALPLSYTGPRPSTAAVQIDRPDARDAKIKPSAQVPGQEAGRFLPKHSPSPPLDPHPQPSNQIPLPPTNATGRDPVEVGAPSQSPSRVTTSARRSNWLWPRAFRFRPHRSIAMTIVP
jgi:hypothetical protein